MSLILLAPGLWLGAGWALAAEPSPALMADIRRAVTAVGASTSEEPALRQARQAGEPSAGFLLGAALGAWINASAQLEFDLKNPAAAGPPHVSQGAPNDDAIAQDCAEETAAFEHLQARSGALGFQPDQVVHAAGLEDAMIAAWRSRLAGAVNGCR